MEEKTGYRLVGRGDYRDLVHVSAAQIAGRIVRVREIIRGRIPINEVRAALAKPDTEGKT